MTRVITSGFCEVSLDVSGNPGSPSKLVQAETCDSYGMTLNVQAWRKGQSVYPESRVVVLLSLGDESRSNDAVVDLYAGAASIWVPAKQCVASAFLEPLIVGIPQRNPESVQVTCTVASGATGGWYRNNRTLCFREPAALATTRLTIPPFAKEYSPVFSELAPNAITCTFLGSDGLTVLERVRIDAITGQTRKIPAGAAFIDVTSTAVGVPSNVSLVFTLGL